MVASPAMPKAPSAPTPAHASVDNHGNAGPLDVMCAIMLRLPERRVH